MFIRFATVKRRPFNGQWTVVHSRRKNPLGDVCRVERMVSQWGKRVFGRGQLMHESAWSQGGYSDGSLSDG